MSIVLSCHKSKWFCVSFRLALPTTNDNDNDRDENSNDDTDNRNGLLRNKHIFGTLAMTMNDTNLSKRAASNLEWENDSSSKS